MGFGQEHRFNHALQASFPELDIEIGQQSYSGSPIVGQSPSIMQGRRDYSRIPLLPSIVPQGYAQNRFNHPSRQFSQEAAGGLGQQSFVPLMPGFSAAGGQNYSQQPAGTQGSFTLQQPYNGPPSQSSQGPAIQAGTNYSHSPRTGFQAVMQARQNQNLWSVPRQGTSPRSSFQAGNMQARQSQDSTFRQGLQDLNTSKQPQQYISNPHVLQSNAPSLTTGVYRNAGINNMAYFGQNRYDPFAPSQGELVGDLLGDAVGQTQVDTLGQVQDGPRELQSDSGQIPTDPLDELQEDTLAEIFSELEGEAFAQTHGDLFGLLAPMEGVQFSQSLAPVEGSLSQQGQVENISPTEGFHNQAVQIWSSNSLPQAFQGTTYGAQSPLFNGQGSLLNWAGGNNNGQGGWQSSMERPNNGSKSSFGHSNAQRPNSFATTQRSNARVHPYARPTSMQNLGSNSGQAGFRGSLKPSQAAQQQMTQSQANQNGRSQGSWPLLGNSPASRDASLSLRQQNLRRSSGNTITCRARGQMTMPPNDNEGASNNDAAMFQVTVPRLTVKHLKFAPPKPSNLRAVRNNFIGDKDSKENELIFISERRIPPSKEEATQIFRDMIRNFPAPNTASAANNCIMAHQIGNQESQANLGNAVEIDEMETVHTTVQQIDASSRPVETGSKEIDHHELSKNEMPLSSLAMEEYAVTPTAIPENLQVDSTVEETEVDSFAINQDAMPPEAVDDSLVNDTVMGGSTLDSLVSSYGSIQNKKGIEKSGVEGSASHVEAHAELGNQQPEIGEINEDSLGTAPVASSTNLQDEKTPFEQFVEQNEKALEKQLIHRSIVRMKSEFKSLEGRTIYYRRKFDLLQQAKEPSLKEHTPDAAQQNAVSNANNCHKALEENAEAGRREVEKEVVEPANSPRDSVVQNLLNPNQLEGDNEQPSSSQTDTENLMEQPQAETSQNLCNVELMQVPPTPFEHIKDNMSKLLDDSIPSDYNFIAHHYGHNDTDTESIYSIKHILKPDAPLLSSAVLARSDFLSERADDSQYALQRGEMLPSYAFSKPRLRSNLQRSQPKNGGLAVSYHSSLNNALTFNDSRVSTG